MKNRATTIALAAAVSQGTRIMSPAGEFPGLLWSMPSHLRRLSYFCGLADTILMGRKMFNMLIAEHPIGDRVLVLTSKKRNPETEKKYGVTVVKSLSEALEISGRTMLVIGGYQTFRETLPYADYLHFTVAHMEIEKGDYFPRFDPARFSCLPQNKVPRLQYDAGDPCQTSYEYHTRVGAPKWP